jgi:hypothetical protein
VPSVLPRRGHTFVTGRAGQPEVDQVHEVVFGDQDVRRLDVPVDQARFVSGIQRRRDLLHHVHRKRRTGRLVTLLEDGAEVAALDQPHVQIEPAIDFAEAVDRHHMRLVEPGRGLRFTPEALLERAVVG